jgi:hypothetical protein
MSRFAVLFAIAGCSSTGGAGAGGSVDAPHATSLAGSVECGTMMCASGQLCYIQYSGIDAGSGDNNGYYCVTPPSGCVVFDCEGEACPKCALSGCESYPNLVDIDRITGRTVGCGGQ